MDLEEEPSILKKPSDPTPRDVNPTAISVTELNRDQIKMYKLLREEYKNKLSDYKEKRAALSDLQKFIMETISRSNLAFIIGLDTVYDVLKALQKRLAPIDRAR